MKLFFRFRMPDFHKRGIESIWNVSGEDRAEAALSMTFRNDPRAMAMSFMRNYGEPYEWLKEVFLDWAFTFMSTYLYYEDRDTADENTLNLYRKVWLASKATRPLTIYRCKSIRLSCGTSTH